MFYSGKLNSYSEPQTVHVLSEWRVGRLGRLDVKTPNNHTFPLPSIDSYQEIHVTILTDFLTLNPWAGSFLNRLINWKWKYCFLTTVSKQSSTLIWSSNHWWKEQHLWPVFTQADTTTASLSSNIHQPKFSDKQPVKRVTGFSPGWYNR